ncbi:bifunctional phosphopantothenoylcysteine decarboxylase/phosphopantothenate--cysteine ligase CoaBC [Candidatus Nitrosacidococcus tergens]|uniref:Coenzyme A biosynthesis bifunctional protein CoaBC n=1 Tax=Candidatus Nitrosacidococcus tergens TaxID=553981 RepID=A0A7G1QBW1_9GAMM|nr:bifunctional phosphopantothenoylcysteine decarboxylase/phosphopantothenate--cysteine ligase CoaBC [Candidatus Nitrosacidococcus tergens]CAB1277500.1 fused 4'-phosphopantothenoylcysteine decarboxylase; phosphopantothenoylcysteine synthetase, FMN-binding [Candidatus Nitrosacidococcus tergens]
MEITRDKRILIGISGSIAAYKAGDLVRKLRDLGAEVRVVMTETAQKFIAPLTFQALSSNPVHTSLMDPSQELAMGHIALARWADLILIAPASADIIARIAQGRGNDLLTAICLTTTAPLAVAPSMNQQMWHAIATQENIATLTRRGVRIWGPNEGNQACGEWGLGRMAEPKELIYQITKLFIEPYLAGLSVLITAGPTREYLDPVRFLSNRSSGKMGYALAEAAESAGAQVTLISGSTSLDTPFRVQKITIDTAQQMSEQVLSLITKTDIFISCAAVSDYQSTQILLQKIKKTDKNITLELKQTIDILKTVGEQPHRPFLVGFAAETENYKENARSKFIAKNLDMIVVNPVGYHQGFEVDTNECTVMWDKGEIDFPLYPKTILAQKLIQQIAWCYHEKHPS